VISDDVDVKARPFYSVQLPERPPVRKHTCSTFRPDTVALDRAEFHRVSRASSSRTQSRSVFILDIERGVERTSVSIG
jgi:hypothetical protein